MDTGWLWNSHIQTRTLLRGRMGQEPPESPYPQWHFGGGGKHLGQNTSCFIKVLTWGSGLDVVRISFGEEIRLFIISNQHCLGWVSNLGREADDWKTRVAEGTVLLCFSLSPVPGCAPWQFSADWGAWSCICQRGQGGRGCQILVCQHLEFTATGWWPVAGSSLLMSPFHASGGRIRVLCILQWNVL